MPETKRVLIVDDHPLFRDGLRGLVERSGRYQVVGEAGSGAEAVALAAELAPHLITMDMSLPDMSGIDATRRILQTTPDVQVLAVSMHSKYDYVIAALRAGARGYVVKDATKDRLVQALDALGRGEMYLDGQATQELVQRLLSGAQADSDEPDRRYALLSPREQQIMRLVVEGLSSREVADKLDITLKTVENHRTNLMKKLDVHDRMELVRYAARLGLIDVEEWKG